MRRDDYVCDNCDKVIEKMINGPIVSPERGCEIKWYDKDLMLEGNNKAVSHRTRHFCSVRCVYEFYREQLGLNCHD